MTNNQLVVTNSEVAKLLVEPKERRFLEPFMAQPCTMSKAATQLGVRINTMFYRVRRLENLGLLEVANQVRRRGRTVKEYRASAAEYIVPFDVTSYETLEALLISLSGINLFFDNLVRSLQSFSLDWGLHISASLSSDQSADVFIAPTDSGSISNPVTIQQFLKIDNPAIWSSGDHLQLNFDQAKSLQAELVNLLLKYQSLNQTTGQTYYLALGLTPTIEESS